MNKPCRNRCLLYSRPECLPEYQMQNKMTGKDCNNYRPAESIVEAQFYQVFTNDISLQVLADTFYMAKLNRKPHTSDSILSTARGILEKWRKGIR